MALTKKDKQDIANMINGAKRELNTRIDKVQAEAVKPSEKFWSYDGVRLVDLFDDYNRRKRRNNDLKLFIRSAYTGITVVLAIIGIYFLVSGGC